MKIAVVGATGMVGRVMLRVLEESKYFPGVELLPAASGRSTGKKVIFRGEEIIVRSLGETLDALPDIAIFSAGTEVSLEWAPRFAEKQCFVIDNSSAWRMIDHVPLVVPEINAGTIRKDSRIIANPNCSTIQMVLALMPLHRSFGIKRLVISTYQSVTGSGAAAVRQLDEERRGIEGEKAYPHPIDLNLFPHGGRFLENGYTTEEQKLVDETRKILGDNAIMVTATVVRVPVYGGHSEAVNVEMKQTFEIETIRELLSATPGITIVDDVHENRYPMPLFAEGKDDVFVGRIRRDNSIPNGLNLWIVSDNLRKGAATNAVQIAEYLLINKFI
ncbi:MAG: aspartate-semialdehyde dehydrogenase [Bacteroidales bacterium]|jgi:aspartate-semialdehyde dehydrogenase|nr:aspartate-semialdehyde dehydrogenase [Bacteroidales bacterium]